MKRIQKLLFLTPAFILAMAVQTAQGRGGDGQKNDDTPNQGVTQDRGSKPSREARPGTAPRSRDPRPDRTEGKMNKQRDQRSAPDQRSEPAPNQTSASERSRRASPEQRDQAVQQPNRVHAMGSRQDRNVDRPAATKPYDRQRLAHLGVRTPPKPITNTSAILRTDRSRSTIRYPRSGPRGERIQGSMVSPRRFNNSTVRAQMSVVNQPSFSQRLDQERRGENQRNRNYWHTDNGFYYNHYIDDWGYHWYGWYRGNHYFWTRNYNGRWWWYDPDYERWCYYQDNYWYWQDPYRRDEIYVYDNDSYISLNFNFHN